MTTFESQTFERFYDRGGAAPFENLDFRKCRFESCAISITRDPSRRTIFRNVTLIRCEQRGCAIDTAVLEDIVVDGFKTHGLLQAWGAVYRHVTLRGRIGSIMLSDKVATGTALPEEQRAFDEANAAYYSTVDWALDISEAEFMDEPDLRGVPGRLIRRDPTTQVLVTREKAMAGAWRGLDLSKTAFDTAIEFLLRFGNKDVVLVAPKKSRKFNDLLDGLKKLRDAGVAEPD